MESFHTKDQTQGQETGQTPAPNHFDRYRRHYGTPQHDGHRAPTAQKEGGPCRCIDRLSADRRLK